MNDEEIPTHLSTDSAMLSLIKLGALETGGFAVVRQRIEDNTPLRLVDVRVLKEVVEQDLEREFE